MFLSKADIRGTIVSESETKYYVDFSKNLKSKGFELSKGEDGKQLVDKKDCVKIKN